MKIFAIFYGFVTINLLINLIWGIDLLTNAVAIIVNVIREELKK